MAIVALSRDQPASLMDGSGPGRTKSATAVKVGFNPRALSSADLRAPPSLPITQNYPFARDWYRTFPPPVLRSTPDLQSRVDLRRYANTPPRMEQPALRENLLCMHLGGAKHVQRSCCGRSTAHDIEHGALTIVPALQANSWLTRGPVDFGLIAIGPELIAQIAVEEFDLEPNTALLRESVGLRSPELEGLFKALLACVAYPGPAGRLYPESLLVVLATNLVREHSKGAHGTQSRSAEPPVRKGGLAQWRLRRVTDYMIQHMSAEIGLAELTALTGLSRSQFFRAFRQSTGSTPHRYLAILRLDKARTLLKASTMSTDEVAAAVGLSRPALAGPFKRLFGVTPRHFQLSSR